MQLRKWKYNVTRVVFGYCLCVTVLFKRNVKGDTYGDLGDEIIVDYPSQPTRKNEIPKGGDASGEGHKIDQRMIMQKTVSHYKNPLFYREFIPRPRPHVRARVPRVPLRSDTRHLNNIRTWRKKDYIHRPMVNDQRLMNYAHAPIPSRYLTRPLYPRTLGITVRRKQANPRVMVARRQYRPSAVLKPRVLSRGAVAANEAKKMKHHLHVQIIPKSPLNPVKAQKLGIHSGFVLLPAGGQPQKARMNIMTQRRNFAIQQQKLKRERGIRTKAKPGVNRFSERKHIWIPSRHMNAQELPVQEMTSYHVDDIGNLIPDNQSQPPAKARTKITVDPLVKNLEKVAMRWAESSPSLRKNIKNNPGWMDALEGAMKPKHAVSQLPRQQLRPAPLSTRRAVKRGQLLPRQKIMTKRPLIAPKSSRRILYFAHNAAPVKKTTTPYIRYRTSRVYPKQYQQTSRYTNKRQRRPSIEQSNISNFIEQLEESLGPPIISKEYVIPRVSPKVYRYINDKTVPSPLTAGMKNPLLRYLQYHRIHPSKGNQRASPVVNSARAIINTRRRMANMQHGRRTPLLIHNRSKRNVGNTRRTSLTNGRGRRALSQLQYGNRRVYPDNFRQPQPITALFRQDPVYQSVMSLTPGNRDKLPWNYYHNERMPDGRVRPALYPISHHIPPGKCLPDGSLCDEGHDEQCCGRSAFCQNYWGISKCVAYSKVTLADMHNPYQIQQNRVYKHFYRYMLSKVELK